MAGLRIALPCLRGKRVAYLSTAYLKDPTDPLWKDDAGIKAWLERDEIRLGLFFSCPGRSAARVLRGPLYFAWGCFRDFLSRPCLAPPKGRYAGSGTRDR